jgi:hypothetical protein
VFHIGQYAFVPTADDLASGLLEDLQNCGTALAPGMTEAELEIVEARFAVRLAPDRRLLLSIALPVGDREWPDWRGGDEEHLRGRLRWPVEGILFDVEKNAFWHPDRGVRPGNSDSAVAEARGRSASVPALVLYGHRFLPTQPHRVGNPVLSCYQTDIICYGYDLRDWFQQEFHTAGRSPRPIGRRIPFWS